MSEPVTIKATVAAWLAHNENPILLSERKPVEVIGMLALYGDPSKKEFGSWVRVGEAEVTLRLIPRDEQVRLAVVALQKKLDEERALWLQKQAEILAALGKLQSLEFNGTVEA